MQARRSARGLAASTATYLALAALLALAAAAVLANAVPTSSALRPLAMGARGVLVVGTGAAVASTAVGVLLGGLAAWFGGWSHSLVTRVLQLLMTFPGVRLVALVRVSWPQTPLWLWVAVLALLRVPEVVRLTRGELVRLSGAQFMLAARAMGASPLRLLLRHAAPHLAPALAVSAVFTVASVVLIDAAVSMLGFGHGWPEASWGSSLVHAVQAGYLDGAVAPAAALLVTLLSLANLAEAVRRRLDPHGLAATPLRQTPAGSR
jgi:ABC-type dipeptide/oligopeptide/nickel transport system permease subunit